MYMSLLMKEEMRIWCWDWKVLRHSQATPLTLPPLPVASPKGEGAEEEIIMKGRERVRCGAFDKDGDGKRSKENEIHNITLYIT